LALEGVKKLTWKMGTIISLCSLRMANCHTKGQQWSYWFSNLLDGTY